MIYNLLKYYAVGRGVLRGLSNKKRQGYTFTDFDQVLKDQYPPVLIEALNRETTALWADHLEQERRLIRGVYGS